MPQRQPNRPENDSYDATVVPLRPARSSTQGTWRVERIDTESMTPQQYEVAVTVLATLVTQWRNKQENAKEARRKAA
ncbi:hypothetical protein FNH05_18655 [Amycolatopsis rhizosphaerae]|uniref:Uncharacterized protein n=1 Tax=Amycolatopsis rhizosphaerae TaxID=2053003 RepID=A0A558CG02_9PSEU|nr:hypothetical protein FNH05_18655 [Amycolatopsis rhizosphaerae]